MKNLLILLSFFSLFVSTCSAQIILEKNSIGETRLVCEKEKQEGDYNVSDSAWESTGIIVNNKAKYYIGFFSEAINNPGKAILVKEDRKVVGLNSLFTKSVEIKKSYVIYDDYLQKINYTELLYNEEEGTPYIILWSLMSLFFMISSNLILYKISRLNIKLANPFYHTKLSVFGAITAFLSLIFFFPFVMTCQFSLYFTAIIFTILVSFIFFIVFSAIENNFKLYRRLSAVYYALMIIFFILIFLKM